MLLSHWKSVASFKKWYESNKDSILSKIGKSLPAPTEFLEFGNVGCVLKTTNPKILIKITDYIEEAEVANVVKENKNKGFTEIYEVIELMDGKHRVWLIWREYLDLVGEEAVRAVAKNLKMDPRKFYDKISRLLESYEKLVLTDASHIITKLKTFQGFEDAAASIADLTETGLVVSDVKIKNIGANLDSKQLVVFDAMLNTSSYFENEYEDEEEEQAIYGEDSIGFYDDENDY